MDLGDPEPSREATPCRPLQAPPSLVRLGRRLSRWVPSARPPPPTIALCGGSPRRCPFAGREPEGWGRGVQGTQSASSVAPGHGRGSVLVEFGGHSPRPVPAPTSSRGPSGTSPRWDHWVHNDRLLASAARGRVRWAFCVVGEAPGPRARASFCTDAWPSAHLCSLLGRHLATGRPCCRRQSESSWVTAALAACGPQTRRAPCPPGPAWTPPLAPGGRPLSAAGAAVAASGPRWWPVTAAAGVTATEQLAGLCRSVAASDRTRSDEDSGSSQSGAGGGPAPPPDPVGAGPPPGSGRWDRRPPLAGRPGPQPPGPRD